MINLKILYMPLSLLSSLSGLIISRGGWGHMSQVQMYRSVSLQAFLVFLSTIDYELSLFRSVR